LAAATLAALGAEVIVVGRNPAKTDAAVDDIRGTSGNTQITGLA
jgi:NAD(P)-dependent dehydrogenase (short-subunit alcohol dehydrogenase family)